MKNRRGEECGEGEKGDEGKVGKEGKGGEARQAGSHVRAASHILSDGREVHSDGPLWLRGFSGNTECRQRVHLPKFCDGDTWIVNVWRNGDGEAVNRIMKFGFGAESKWHLSYDVWTRRWYLTLRSGKRTNYM